MEPEVVSGLAVRFRSIHQPGTDGERRSLRAGPWRIDMSDQMLAFFLSLGIFALLAAWVPFLDFLRRHWPARSERRLSIGKRLARAGGI
jgi:hypothetical protein